jgi:hypothetical protein
MKSSEGTRNGDSMIFSSRTGISVSFVSTASSLTDLQAAIAVRRCFSYFPNVTFGISWPLNFSVSRKRQRSLFRSKRYDVAAHFFTLTSICDQFVKCSSAASIFYSPSGHRTMKIISTASASDKMRAILR